MPIYGTDDSFRCLLTSALLFCPTSRFCRFRRVLRISQTSPETRVARRRCELLWPSVSARNVDAAYMSRIRGLFYKAPLRFLHITFKMCSDLPTDRPFFVCGMSCSWQSLLNYSLTLPSPWLLARRARRAIHLHMIVIVGDARRFASAGCSFLFICRIFHPVWLIRACLGLKINPLHALVCSPAVVGMRGHLNPAALEWSAAGVTYVFSTDDG